MREGNMPLGVEIPALGHDQGISALYRRYIILREPGEVALQRRAKSRVESFHRLTVLSKDRYIPDLCKIRRPASDADRFQRVYISSRCECPGTPHFTDD